MKETYDVVVIGAGPSGAIASALLHKKGYRVCVLEKQRFPRFVIGESLLPHCMEFIEEAGMLEAVQNAAQEAGFQFKNGAAFTWGERQVTIDFTDKFTPGPGTTYQVLRSTFDHILINEAQKQGVEVYFEHTVQDVQFSDDAAYISVQDDQEQTHRITAKFVLDASGYGRVLARLLSLEDTPSLVERMAYFTHIDDQITDASFDRNKILISTHPQYRDVWLWLIPFSNGRSSIGVVGTPERLNHHGETEPSQILKKFAYEVPMLARILDKANWENDVPYRTLRNYSAKVKSLYGDRFALLGNASEFLDPVFSSGVTIAMHSAKVASDLLDRQFKGEHVDWQKEYADHVMIGVEAFKTYVMGWYDLRFQNVLYSHLIDADVKRKISAILAGYAWDTHNPLVAKSERGLNALAEYVGEASPC